MDLFTQAVHHQGVVSWLHYNGLVLLSLRFLSHNGTQTSGSSPERKQIREKTTSLRKRTSQETSFENSIASACPDSSAGGVFCLFLHCEEVEEVEGV